MKIGLIGCGYVADYYVATLRLHPELKVVGVADRVDARAQALASAHGFRPFGSVAELLADQDVQMVLNLTNPREHYAVSRAALLAGKHVYSEKPFAMEMDQARELVELAERAGLQISAAPCSLHGQTAQTLWRELRADRVGKVRAVYAEIDDGMVHRMAYRKWKSRSGLPWPYRDEFEVGCTVEHAGYYLTWFAAWFGPAERVTAFASVQVPDKVPGEALGPNGPDLTVACVQFRNGVVARLTCSILAPHDHRLRVVGDDGILTTRDCWDYRSPVRSQRLLTVRRRSFISPWPTRHALVPSPYPRAGTGGAQDMDFARGPAELAAAITARRTPLLSARFCLHVNEMVLAIHNAATCPAYTMTTQFEPLPVPAGI